MVRDLQGPRDAGYPLDPDPRVHLPRLRESQLEVEAVPRGCPPDFDFLPDLDTFYSEWLGRPLPDTKEFEGPDALEHGVQR